MKTSSGPVSIRQHLSKFAIATVLVAGLLALAWPVEAEIVYTKVNIHVGRNSSYNLDLNNDGVTDFTISTSYSVTTNCTLGDGTIQSVTETPATGNGAEGSFPYPARLAVGAQIGPSQIFYGGAGTMASLTACPGDNRVRGDWITYYGFGESGYLGLMFQINGETHYGWAHLSTYFSSKPFEAALIGYAYETTPDMPINAGQTSGGDDFSALDPGPVNRDGSGIVSSVTNPTQALMLGTIAPLAQEVPLLRMKESAGAAPENI